MQSFQFIHITIVAGVVFLVEGKLDVDSFDINHLMSHVFLIWCFCMDSGADLGWIQGVSGRAP